MLRIIEPSPLTADQVRALTRILQTVVAEGASVGYLTPPSEDVATAYWRALPRSGVRLFLAEVAGAVVGTVQLHDAESANGTHRAEVCKLLVSPEHRRQGIASALLAHVESAARTDGKLLLHLDTRAGDPSNLLYRSTGWTEAGAIPAWARSTDGTLEMTVFWFRDLRQTED